MAIYKPGVLAVDIRGSVGPAVFSKSHAGLTIRSRVKPVNPNTSRQALARSYMAQASQKWASFDTDQYRAQWIAAAASLPATNRVGVATTLSPGQLFTRINAFRLAVDQAMVSEPAPVQTAAAPSATITGDGDGTITLSGMSMGTGACLALAWVSGPWTTGRKYPRGPWRAPVQINPTQAASGVELLSGALQNQRYFVRIRWIDYDDNTMSGVSILSVDMPLAT